MTYPEWPLSLPHAQMEGDGSGPMFLAPIETEMEGGDQRRRRRPGDNLIRQRLAFRFTADEAATWSTFVRSTLGNATARFLMPVSVDGAACETRVVQIIGVPNYDGRNGSLRMFSFEVWLFPTDMVPAFALDFSAPMNSQYLPLFF